jgi:hypothetical protein
MTALSAKGIETLLADALADANDNGVPATEAVREVATFDAAGIMSYDKGLVITLTDGTEFQVTVVRTA